MKPLFLREVRRNYSIVHFPEGYRTEIGNDYFKNAYVLFFKDEILRAQFDKKKLIDILVEHFRKSKNK